MLRKLALSLAVSAALGASQVNALGLGEIQVNSALNEPLDAEIKLTQVRDLSPLQIQPRMASLDEYATSMGSSQARYLRDIQFQVLVSPEGTGRIRLKSTEPVQEPFLNFMVEVNWPSGRLVREYTLLLDPPVFEPSPVRQRLTPASVQPAAAVSQPANPRASVTASNIRTRANSDTQVYVGVNDTLWEIAKKTKPQGISEHQMMLALLRKNPQAFPSGNINNLKAGTVMDIPSLAEAQQLSHREAVAEVARQMQAWRQGRSSTNAPVKAPLDVSKTAEAPADDSKGSSAAAPANEAAEEGKLTIVAPPPESAAPEQVSSATSSVDSDAEQSAAVEPVGEQVISAAAERLEDEVLMAQEKIDRLERDNADLNDKLSSVLEQLESQSRLLELQSQQMSTLQAELSKPRPAPVVPPAQPVQSEATSPSLFENPTVLGGLGAGAIALLGGIWFLLRRKRPEPAAKKELVNVPDDLREREERDAVPDVAAAAVAGGAAVVAADALSGGDEKSDTDFVRPPMDSLAPAEEEVAVEDLEKDLQELDLDMDLDLDDLDQSDLDADAEGVDSSEFDLGLDDEPPMKGLADADEELEDTELAAELETGEAADDVDDLAFTLDNGVEAEEDDTSSELDAMLADRDVDDELDFLLNDSIASDEAESEALDLDVDFNSDSSDTDELDFETLAADVTDPAPVSSTEVEPDADNSLHETVEAAEEVEFEIDPDLEAMLKGGDEPSAVDSGSDDDGLEFDMGFADDSATQSTDTAEDDLDSLLSSFDPEDDVEIDQVSARLTNDEVEEELTANISHDLEMDLDAEVDELLGGTDDDIELEELHNEEQDEVLDKLNLLSDADEIETKLDLARAYIEMEDTEGARDILNEITGEGSDSQREEARKLLETLA
ncbi:FimV/HubP family polar landmark protein [Marinobacterium sediminicola]|uniref:Pilus assembly protein FimV n=1 Tax=Marinobacterium sediminicola TaxID=518898 RepID=A0ABY1RVK9_9GAMM|nr:FimV/HubP family polar landmark protein [Marinobacterium sediminicola]ULG70631.1 hypothetical protein LN244_07410 [Marinobacterium sediminicola]SMR68808.1 pilus assembly protein FimV [Marinobacterium sediminicola]